MDGKQRDSSSSEPDQVAAPEEATSTENSSESNENNEPDPKAALDVALQENSSPAERVDFSGSPESIGLLINYINEVGGEAKNSRGKAYPHAFEVTEEDIRRLDKRVREILKIPSPLIGEVEFSGTVRFQDISTQRFSDLEELLDRAGELKDPETLRLYWRVMLREPFGHVANVTIRFTTEAPLETELKGILDRHSAYMELTVNGPSNEWAEASYGKIDPILRTLIIGGIYKPLTIFAKDTFISIIAWPLAVLAQITSYILFQNITSSRSTSLTLQQILRLPTLKEQFDAYLKNVYSSSSPIASQVLVMGLSLTILIAAYFAVRYLLPLLAPRSGIEIGLAGRRIQRYRNTFNFIIFSMLLLGIIIPLITNLID